MPEGHTLYRLAADLDQRVRWSPGPRQQSAGSVQRRRSGDRRACHGPCALRGQARVRCEFDNDRRAARPSRPDRRSMSFGRRPRRRRSARSGSGSRTTTRTRDLRGATICELISPAGRCRHPRAPRCRPAAGRRRPGPGVRPHPPERAPIGALLMDQSVVSGVGNVYRAESLFRARLHPLTQGRRSRSDAGTRSGRTWWA